MLHAGELTLKINSWSKAKQLGSDCCLTSKPFNVGGHVFKVKMFPCE